MPYAGTVLVDLLVTPDPKIESVSLRGDRKIALELLNHPGYAADYDSYEYVGWVTDPLFFNAIRVEYPYSRTSTTTYTTSVSSAMADVGLTDSGPTVVPPETFFGAAALRVYDMGECSFGATWDDIAEYLDGELESAVDDLQAQIGSIASVRIDHWYMRPILRRDGSTEVISFHMDVRLDGPALNAARVSAGVVLTPKTSSSQLFELESSDFYLNVYDVRGLILRLLLPDEETIEAYLRDLVQEEVLDRINTLVINGIAAISGQSPATLNLFRARRVQMSARGLDLIFADDTNDSQYNAFAGFGACASAPPASPLSRQYWYRIPYSGL